MSANYITVYAQLQMAILEETGLCPDPETSWTDLVELYNVVFPAQQ